MHDLAWCPLRMVPDGNSGAPADGCKSVSGTAVRKQPVLKRSSGGTTSTSKPAGARKNSGAEYGSAKSQAAVTFRRSLSQTELTKDFEVGLQRPSKPLQFPIQLPLQLPAGKAQLTAVGTRKWLKIEASGSTSIMQVAMFPVLQNIQQCSLCHGFMGSPPAG